MPPTADAARAREIAAGIVRTLRRSGHVALFAGGCVRDELLGLAPTDYDVATDATPDRIMALFPRTREVGVSFGVVQVRRRHVTVEVATFRSDGPYSDRRRPDVIHFSDPVADARRRDFTINALFLDPEGRPDPPRARGRVIDHVGGLADLDARIIRAVGDPEQRLAEDHLRALRAVRLAARLGFDIDPTTADAIRDHAAGLSGVSRERIGEELRKMLAHPARARALHLLGELSLDSAVLGEPGPGPAPLTAVIALPEDAAPMLGLAAWAVDRGSDAGVVPRWRHALALSNDESDRLRRTLAGLEYLRAGWRKAGAAGRKRAASIENFSDSLLLLRSREPDAATQITADVQILSGTPSGLAPIPMVTGDDLIAAGMAPGPGFRRLLDELYDAQLEDRVTSREQALELIRDRRV